MADEKRSAFDAVEQGPKASEGDTGTPRGSDGDASGHPPVSSGHTVAALRGRFGSTVLHHEVQAGDQQVVFVDALSVREVMEWLRDDPEQRYDLLADLTAVDYGGGKPIQIVYQLWSIGHKRALRIKCELPLAGLSIDSVVQIWSAANWLEREVYDLFGVEFRDHPDLRRILMPQNYTEGHPLRKDFPLRGRLSRAEQTRRALSQDYRDDYTPEWLEMGGAPGLEPPEPDPSTENVEEAP